MLKGGEVRHQVERVKLKGGEVRHQVERVMLHGGEVRHQGGRSGKLISYESMND